MKIAIDGPAGSGKSTIAKRTAKELGFKHIDTGAFYRWVTCNALEKGLRVDSPEEVIELTKTLSFSDIPDEKIRTTPVNENVSPFAGIKGVRLVVVDKQREFAAANDVVMEGRDIGSVVFPDAEIKIYLNASVDERAERRFNEIKNNPDFKGLDFETIKKQIIERDRSDMERPVSPLVKVEDALEIDTTGMSIDEVVVKVLDIVREKR